MIYKGSRLKDKLLLFYIRKIPGHPFKIRIINYLNDLFFNNAIKVKSAGNKLLHLSTREYMSHEIIFSGHYEPFTLKLCESLLNNGGIFLDIGANMGLYSVHLSGIKNLKIYAFEPSSSNFQKLLSNIHLNKAKNIIPINVALSDKDSFGCLVNYSQGNSGTFQVVDKSNDEASYLIRLCKLSDVIKYYDLISIDLIKIDVEGFEMNVFKGFFSGTSIKPLNIVMEFTDHLKRTGYSLEECYNYIAGFGYEAFTVTGNNYNLGDNLPETNLWFKRKNVE